MELNVDDMDAMRSNVAWRFRRMKRFEIDCIELGQHYEISVWDQSKCEKFATLHSGHAALMLLLDLMAAHRDFSLHVSGFEINAPQDIEQDLPWA